MQKKDDGEKESISRGEEAVHFIEQTFADFQTWEYQQAYKAKMEMEKDPKGSNEKKMKELQEAVMHGQPLADQDPYILCLCFDSPWALLLCDCDAVYRFPYC